MKTKDEVAVIMQDTFARLDKLREAGQKEYAHDEDNAFANFERVSNYLGIDREKVLWTYLQKHLDGIVAFINGHRSQRESVHGRIDDAHVYLELLRAMIIDEGFEMLKKADLNEKKFEVVEEAKKYSQFEGENLRQLGIPNSSSVIRK
jgi:hypothetical protein